MKQFGLLFCLFVLGPLWLGLGHCPQARAQENPAAKQLEDKQVRECREQMLRVYKGIVRYHDERKRLPSFLSDLVPDYCHVEDLTCPATKTVGNSDWARRQLVDEALHDPRCPTSTYSYEFIEKYWRNTTISYREYKNAQREYLDLHGGKGASVPILRCFVHGPRKFINLTFGGELNVSGDDWEDQFTNSVQLELKYLLPEYRIRLVDDLPPRPPGLAPNLLDLTTKYNGSLQRSWYHSPITPERSFAQLLINPTFAQGQKFDARGVIQLRGRQMREAFPTRCEEITVGQRAHGIHFLIGAYGQAPPGQRIARLTLNYGERPAFPLDVHYAVDVLDWRVDPGKPGGESVKDKVAWESKPIARSVGPAVEPALNPNSDLGPVRLYDFSRANPYPDAEILSIDFEVSATDVLASEAAPALFAVTLQP